MWKKNTSQNVLSTKTNDFTAVISNLQDMSLNWQ